MISHELRTPLTTILSSADLLECYNNSWSEEKKLQHLRQIQNAAVEMTQLLESEEFSQQLKACARQLQ
ncbi:histidine kinase dimerization/phospho-acceptor domain-containing protein [Phormidium sp. CCY1219]|uniref:histidine kinase dimerization/phospho-acceptor domain-containing protein n=1 Tax=Phormidium sp. CCY1219 TaxID=2886104 RepID=UPI002D1F469C|nr:histidine kinase dimerization/phospho-acceptor domain-containing protein [Phormidium sp. CCY1219]MEB3830796.1 hypothetical protein [Phormidium sp. CCY1219]